MLKKYGFEINVELDRKPIRVMHPQELEELKNIAM